MSNAIPSIDQLKELSLPAPVSYVPQTWGWWVLLALLIGAALVIGARRYWHWRQNRYRREALVRLAELQNNGDPVAALRQLPELLKRVALSMPKPSPVGASLLAKRPSHPKHRSTASLPSPADSFPQGPAALSKDKWQVFLQQHSPQQLPVDFAQQLAQLAYAPDATLAALPEQQRQQLFALSKTWVEQHHVAA